MTWATRISLPGYNALTDTEVDHFALYTDIANILIKESVRGSTSVSAGSSTNIAHGFAYLPMALVFAEKADGNVGTTGRWFQVGGPDSFNGGVGFRVTTTNVVLINDYSNAKTFKYYIFYDQQV